MRISGSLYFRLATNTSWVANQDVYTVQYTLSQIGPYHSSKGRWVDFPDREAAIVFSSTVVTLLHPLMVEGLNLRGLKINISFPW